MQQLSGLDSTFLNIETPTTYGHVSGLAIFDPSTTSAPGSFEDLKDLIADRIHMIPPYRRRLIEVPFGIDQPYWIEDPDFDLDFHIRHIGLPPPGDDHQLAELVERIHSRPLDRSRPLWELYMIEGLESGHIAQLSKIHHCAIDGVSGAELLANLLDITPEIREIEPPEKPWRPDSVPSDAEMIGRGLLAVASTPSKGFRLARDSVGNLPALARTLGIEVPGARALQRVRSGGDADMLSQAPGKPPRTSFNSLIGPHRKFAFTTMPLADLKELKHAFGVTLNDVVMALCSSALRQYLLDRNELPDDPLIAMVPVSVRTEDQAGTLGNQIASMTASLHTDLADPEDRLRGISTSMQVAKDTHHALPAALLQDFAEFSPPAVAARAARTIARASARAWVDLPYNLVISNVPGPQFPLYGGGAQLVSNYPVSAVHDGVGLNITVQSYNGNLDFGLVGCRDLIPDLWDLIDHLHAATAELQKAAAAAKKTSKQRSAMKTSGGTKKAAAATKASSTRSAHE